MVFAKNTVDMVGGRARVRSVVRKTLKGEITKHKIRYAMQ